MKDLIMPREPGLPGLALRLGLGWVLLAWGYDLYFNPHYYAKWLGGFTAALMILHLLIGALLVTGLATRIVAPAAAALFAAFGIALTGHQPIGLPQNAGLAAGAIALWLLGPGELALGAAPPPAPPARLAWAAAALRAGLALTFLTYGIQKFTHGLEYRIVVANVPVLRPVVEILGAGTTVAALGILEILVSGAMLVPPLLIWGGLAQAVALGAFLAGVGYPFSYPQDVGLLGAVSALLMTHWVRLGARLTAPRFHEPLQFGVAPLDAK